jgi:hypothetical protein
MGSILQKSEARNQKPENALAPATRPTSPAPVWLLVSVFWLLMSPLDMG